MNDLDPIQRLAHEVTGGARDGPGRFRSFLTALEAVLRFPADAHVIGEPVEILGLDYSGHSRQGLMARCRRDGREYVVSVSDITLPSTSPAAKLVAAYRLWCGLDPVLQASVPRPPKAAPEDVPEDRPVELVVLALKQSAARCRLLGSDRQITLRATSLWKLVPGDIVTVQLPAFEMEEAIPEGDDVAIFEAIGALEARDFEHARQVLEDVLARDLRCIAARELLASMAFRALPLEALRYHESGVRVGDLSFPPDFRGVLPWPWPGNRPFLRCLHGYGLCLWRLKRLHEALVVLERLLGLDPDDHQGARAIVGAVERRQPWEAVEPELAGGGS